MITVGMSDAKAQWSSLLDKVAADKAVLITKHGKPAARLVRAVEADKSKIDDVIARIKDHRKRIRLGGLHWKTLRDEGRR
jgi:prevent-host-death family protein